MSSTTPSKMPESKMGGRRRRGSRGRRGGNGAADYATAVYGNTDSQHAQPGSNIIAATQVRSGGRNSKGGNVLNDIAVPAVLLYANHTYGRNRGAFPMRKTFRRKNRGSRRRRSFRRRR
jgi:hypothetical protein